MKFVLFLALAIAGLAAIAVFAAEGENGTVSKYDYRASSSDRSLPFARRSEPLGASKVRGPFRPPGANAG
jgi:hypothetical protein